MNIYDITLEERKKLPRTNILVEDQWIEYWDLDTTIKFAEESIAKLLPEGWKFVLFKGVSWLGQCVNRRKEIRMNEDYVYALPAREVADTIIHEIAHALCDIRHGTIWKKDKWGNDGKLMAHGKEWKDICREIGCRPYAKCKLYQCFGFVNHWLPDSKSSPYSVVLNSGNDHMRMPVPISEMFQKMFNHTKGDFDYYMEMCMKANLSMKEALKAYRNMKAC
ncbi:hypothetical protein CPT_Muldoon_254 [Serratia phage Muldoon]|uniref:SprT-like domain-containing protein n=1 Tax=Serratia phage Muldoon TaxID=2601678 RepID=A0A5P8PHS8_9CAUD|nr:hypothetical protein HYP94_gp136 [Serratia phage Muldoon]QFR56205.1 hypothetical protein CPT_Muldoon_254 [Serratia phage Muldoon]